MADLKKTLIKIIKEEKRRIKNDILLEAPMNEQDPTRNVRVGNKTKVTPPPEMSKVDHDTKVNTTVVEPNNQDTEHEPRDRIRDLRPGFNLYHGVVTQVFTQLHSLEGDSPANEIIKKVTQWGLMQLKNGDTEGVFQGENNVSPQQVAAIVQKSMLIILNHIAQEAQREAIDRDAYDAADRE